MFRQIQRLVPVGFVRERLVTDRSMIGLHVRNVFDVPRDTVTNVNVTGKSAVAGAEKEYGKEISDTLLQWRKASHWRNFVPQISKMLRDYQLYVQHNSSAPKLKFYLAADTNDAYEGLRAAYPDHMLFTRRDCGSQRCDFRDCRWRPAAHSVPRNRPYRLPGRLAARHP